MSNGRKRRTGCVIESYCWFDIIKFATRPSQGAHSTISRKYANDISSFSEVLYILSILHKHSLICVVFTDDKAICDILRSDVGIPLKLNQLLAIAEREAIDMYVPPLFNCYFYSIYVVNSEKEPKPEVLRQTDNSLCNPPRKVPSSHGK